MTTIETTSTPLTLTELTGYWLDETLPSEDVMALATSEFGPDAPALIVGCAEEIVLQENPQLIAQIRSLNKKQRSAFDERLARPSRKASPQ